MNARILMTVAALCALGAPAAAMAKNTPLKEPAKHAAKHAVKRHVAPRVLCICVTIPNAGLSAVGQDAFEAQVDADLIAHGLEPVYGAPANAALEAQYDALLIASGRSPVFGAAAG